MVPNPLENAEAKKRPQWLPWLAGVVACVALFWLYFQVCDQTMLGFLHDDGVYSLTAKALALGKGYKLLNLPASPPQDFIWQVKYPIAYPLLLSLAWLIQPAFPANLPWQHGLTVACAAIAIPLLYCYLRHVKQATHWLSGLICLLVAANFHFIYYASAIMSEAPYFLWSLLALWLAENKQTQPTRRMAALIACSTLAFHSRTIGITLIAAVFIGFILRKQWKIAAFYLIPTLLLTAIPWGLWVKTHSMVLNPLTYPLAYVYGGYGIEYGINSPSDLWAYLYALLTKGLLPVIDSWANLMLPQVSFWLSPTPWAYALLSWGLTGLLLHQALGSLKERQFSTSGLYVGFYLMAVVLWMYPNQTLRFLIMILPWLWLIGTQGIILLANKLRLRISGLSQPVRYLLLSLLGFFLLWPSVPGYQLLYRMRSQHLIELSGKTTPLWDDYQSTFEFFRQATKPSDRIASVWDPMFYLYTGHPTIGLFTSSLQPIQGQLTPESFQRLRASLRHYDVRYMVVEPFIVNQELKSPINPVVTILFQSFPNEFQLVYTAPHRFLKVYRVSAR